MIAIDDAERVHTSAENHNELTHTVYVGALNGSSRSWCAVSSDTTIMDASGGACMRAEITKSVARMSPC